MLGNHMFYNGLGAINDCGLLGNHMFYNGLGNKNSGLRFSKKGPAARGVGPKRKLLKTTSVQVILSRF